jgi:putative membrane protein
MTPADMWLNGWGVFIWLAPVAFWVLLIVVVVAMLRGRPESPAAGPGGPALRTLEERYARGEIPREEFLERRAVLRGDQGGTSSAAS